jgi:transposase
MVKLGLSEKTFIDISRKSGKSCIDIAQELGVKLRLVYKWSALIKKRLALAPFKVVP